MVQIPKRQDPTLDKLNEIVEIEGNSQEKRNYLGMSSIGESCARKLWYRLHTNQKEYFNADTLRRFEDGHRTEDLIVSWFKKIPNIELHEVNGDGKQFRLDDLNGKYAGHMDGVIKGLYQAPKSWHVFEVKCTNEKNFKKLKKLILDDEKTALKKWSETYYAQAVSYMKYTGIDRHYLVCATAGGRELTSVRTESNNKFADALTQKAKRIIDSKEPLQKISQDKNWWECKFCSFRDTCHELQ